MCIQAEFQAVVLAGGRGSRMLEVTAGQPKCLLPVGPKPLLWYPLRKLQDAGFTEALVVVLEQQRATVQSAMEREPLTIKLDYVGVAEDSEDLGTAESLRTREVRERLKSDVLVMSCDLVSDVDLDGVVTLFRKHDASVAALMLPPQAGESLQVPGPKTKHKPERDLVGVDGRTGRLVLLASASDFESNVALPLGRLRRHPHLQVHSGLTDSHIYVLKRWVLDYLVSEPSFMSLKGELIPYVVKKQLSRPIEQPEGSLINVRGSGDIWAFAQEAEVRATVRGLSSFNDHAGDLRPAYHDDPIRCYVHLAPKTCMGLRVNTLPAYWSVNAKVQDLWGRLTGGEALPRLNPTAQVQSNQMDKWCVVWEGAHLGERTSFKGAIIGPNASIDSLSRVFNSIVMGNVMVQDRVALEGCIVCDGAVIGRGARLKNCIVGSGHRVPPDSDHTNEILTEALMHF